MEPQLGARPRRLDLESLFDHRTGPCGELSGTRSISIHAATCRSVAALPAATARCFCLSSEGAVGTRVPEPSTSGTLVRRVARNATSAD
ncbi:MAG: hypothetical protein AVDCRST_MAG67-1779 [uncultured Solirubrobacteraceae bacterium]|uniref:Uncharacterized protein n=1 Tax=uncultured Solirubrobacteraceae bacterium TaxID=1162706 RepID=A0A6J4SIT9_9ACTN|nr:MAG: hypothetical protein AVDCRST_MAG67-1779 [uncultured Solirubrobacteraceae bacterium]